VAWLGSAQLGLGKNCFSTNLVFSVAKRTNEKKTVSTNSERQCVCVLAFSFGPQFWTGANEREKTNFLRFFLGEKLGFYEPFSLSWPFPPNKRWVIRFRGLACWYIGIF
jgi:hypothetical protein